MVNKFDAMVRRSTAKTAYGLLSDVCRQIAREPSSYNQSRWIVKREQTSIFAVTPCGTVGCVAGWTAVLHSGRGRVHNNNAGEIAALVLRLSPSQQEELFGFAVFETAWQPGTAAYAADGIAHIRRFQQKYAKQLKATKITRKPATTRARQ